MAGGSGAGVGGGIGAFVAAAPGRTCSEAVRDAARQCLLDWLGVALAGAREPTADVVRATVAELGAPGRARVLLGPATAPPLAALANATMGHCLDYDDTRAEAASHLGSPTWAATLAVAQARGADGERALGAFVTGFEVAARLGGTAFDRACQERGFHPTSVFGRFAAAAAGAVLAGLPAERVEHAMGAAATTCSGLNASFGTMSKPFHSGKAAMDGLLCASLAEHGFVAATDLFESPRGLPATLVQDGSVTLSDLGLTAGESLLANSFKPYACGKLSHGHIDAARELRGPIAGRPIARIRALVAPIGARLVGRPRPRTALEAKFSIAYAMALALLGHELRPADFSEAHLADPTVRALMDVVELEVSDAVGDFGAVVDVELEDGETLHHEVAISRGNPENPLSWADLEAKYLDLAGPVLGAEAAERARALVRAVERPGNLEALLAVLDAAGTG